MHCNCNTLLLARQTDCPWFHCLVSCWICRAYFRQFRTYSGTWYGQWGHVSFTTPAADLEAIVYNASISACAKADRTEALSLLAELLEETLWRSPELWGRRDNTMLGRTVLVSVTLYCGLAFWLHQLPTLNVFQISPFTNLSRQDQTFRHHDMRGQLSRLEYHGASNVVSYSAAMPAAWLRYPSRKVGYCISCYIILQYIHYYPLLSITIHYYPKTIH